MGLNNRLKKYVVIVVIILLMLTGCKSQEDENLIKMAMIPKVIGSAYFDQCANGAIEAAKKLGIEVIYRGPTTADAASQVNIIQDMIFKKVDIIAISPIDSAAVKPILQNALEAGIIVITYDADVSSELRDVFVSQVSSETLGRHMMDNIAEGIGGEGQFAILTASLTASNQNTWIKWMERQLEEKYPRIELVSILPTEEDQQKAYAQTQNLIQAYPDLKGIVALSTVAGPGAARVIELLGVKEEIQLYGLALPNDMNGYLKNGVAQKITLWNPIDLGYLTVNIAKQVYMGEALVNGAIYGGVGPVTYLERESIIIMDQPLDFTKDNVDAYDF